MTPGDRRSWRVALVHDSVVNAHAGGSAAHDARVLFHALIDLGFGIVQLPPAELPAAATATAIELALDQMTDYGANGYRTVWLRGGPAAGDAGLAGRITAECARRKLDLGIIDVESAAGDATPAVERLRALAS
jgi:hypothetical protein